MHSSLISKIEKAITYAEERERVSITSFSAKFRGNHNSHEVSYDDGNWHCRCPFFASHGLCSHTMALERILEGMLLKGTKSEIVAQRGATFGR